MATVTLGSYPVVGVRRFGRQFSSKVSSLHNAVHSSHHGLGTIPNGCDIWMENTNAHQGYHVGDKVPLAKNEFGTAETISVSYDDERIYVSSLNNNFKVVTRSDDPGSSNINKGYWRLRIRPYVTTFV